MTRDAIRALIASRIGDALTDAHFPDLPGYSRGKVRDSYDLADGRRIMIATDRQSAFDQVLAAVPFKGQVLTETARFWFQETRDIIANHVIADPDPNVVVVRRLDMLPVEVVVRDYLTGSTSTSIWPMYETGARDLYGIRFPDGLTKNQKLPETILTPTTKAAHGDHDAPITPAEIVDQGLLTAAQWDEVSAMALALFARGREVAARNGLILVDTKYEFGLDEAGRLTLADEIHTPDSSRYWQAGSYPDRFATGAEPESLDKDFLRLWIRERCDPYAEPIPEIPEETIVDFGARYVALFETVTGGAFVPPPTDRPVRERIRAALRSIVP